MNNSPYFSLEYPGNHPKLFAPDIMQSPKHEISGNFSSDGSWFFMTRSALNFQEQNLLAYFWNGSEWSEPQILKYPQLGKISGGSAMPITKDLVIRCFPPQEKVALYRTHFSNGKWEEPKPMTTLNDPTGHTAFPSFANNGNIYFHSNRAGGIGIFDLYMAKWNDGKFDQPINLGSPINHAGKNFHPCIAPDECFIIFDSPDLESERESHDLFISFKDTDGQWQKPQNLGDTINSKAGDFRTSFTPDMNYMLFSSSRKVGDQEGVQNLYWVSTEFITKMT